MGLKGRFKVELEFLEGEGHSKPYPGGIHLDISWIITSKKMFENRLGKLMS